MNEDYIRVLGKLLLGYQQLAQPSSSLQPPLGGEATHLTFRVKADLCVRETMVCCGEVGCPYKNPALILVPLGVSRAENQASSAAWVAAWGGPGPQV